MNEDLKKYHNNLNSLVGEITKLVPESLDKRDTIFALIKTYIHNEKHFIWKDLTHWLDKDNVDFVYERLINPKIETHSTEAWGNYDKNLEWVKEHQALSNSIKFIRCPIITDNKGIENVRSERIEKTS